MGLSLKFQITAILPELTVYDNLLLSLQAHQPVQPAKLSRSRRALDADVGALLDQFRLSAKADDLAEMSHGEQQWLEIAMALALKPKMLLAKLDEPTGGMIEERRVTGELLAPIRDYCALVIVEHDLDFIKDICDNLDGARQRAGAGQWHGRRDRGFDEGTGGLYHPCLRPTAFWTSVG